MKLGIIGLPQSGKNTVFEAITHNFASTTRRVEDRLATVQVSDNRLTVLSKMYNPKKTVNAQVEYFLPNSKKNSQNLRNQNSYNQIRDCDALVHVIRNFGAYDNDRKSLYDDFLSLDQDLILSDIMVIEKRLERLILDKKRGKKLNLEEFVLLKQCLTILEKEEPLRRTPEIVNSKILRGYAFLSAKPVIILINNNDDDDKIPEDQIVKEDYCMVIRAKLEQELAQMSEEDSLEFLNEFNISSPATYQVITTSYRILGLISFFTVGHDEVRAWTVKANTTALDAAEVIHSDIKKGFIRAELISYDDLLEAESYSNAKKKGTVRLEGKTYTVCDGDIINFRFNV